MTARIGIDLGGTKIEGIVMQPNGEISQRLRVATPQNDYLGTIHAIGSLAAKLQTTEKTTCSVGICTPGAIAPHSGRMQNCNSTCLNDQPLLQDLEKQLSHAVRMANDADCLALSEASDGAAAGAATVFGAILGTGVGGGIVVNGQLLAGPNAIAGEWGHNPLPWPTDNERPGQPCYCGLNGCIETFLSGPGFAADFQRRGGDASLDAAAIAAMQGESTLASECLEVYCQRLARALAGVINTIDPHVIVLGGGMSNIEHIYKRVPEIWGQWVFSDKPCTRLAKAQFGDASGVRGAAWLWPQAH